MKRIIRFFFLFFILVSGHHNALCDTSNVADMGVYNAPPKSAASDRETPKGTENHATNPLDNPVSSYSFILSLSILIFGVIIIVLIAYLSLKKIINTDHIFKCVILTLVITGSLFLVTAGYSNSQITGVLGILGSISGYLLGKMDNNNPKDHEKANTKQIS